MIRKPTILIAEDDPHQVFLLSRALQRSALDATFRFVENGQEAVDYFNASGKYSDRQVYPMPDVGIFDINMPHLTGLGLLEWVRKHNEFARLPVMILTSSTDEKNIHAAKALGADDYLMKSDDYGAMANQIKRFVMFFTSGAAQMVACTNQSSDFISQHPAQS